MSPNLVTLMPTRYFCILERFEAGFAGLVFFKCSAIQGSLVEGLERSESRGRDEGKGKGIPFQISDNVEKFAADLLCCHLTQQRRIQLRSPKTKLEHVCWYAS
ncbi:PREDICTED: uncharacterized protein LOC103331859 [Prunus mume]|uniref:Uncharacterized protein LOC103331859 n=1 Tax=Prunus mume TaxID=102107 RepID=A0ABM0P0S7_PRUMU|nr:PREDICTED: uncharacterized protein LOC103331859 [Prunus mume]